jgi:hypothetical protein
MTLLLKLGKILPECLNVKPSVWRGFYVKSMHFEWCKVFSNGRTEAEFDSQLGHLIA